MSRKEWILVIIVLAAYYFLSSRSTVTRTGYGPYDTTDYSSLDAIQEIREYRWEQTEEARYGDPYDRYYEEPDISLYDIYGPPEDY